MKNLLSAVAVSIIIASAVLSSASTTGNQNRAPATAVKNRAPLPASRFYPLPLTSVRPKGWLQEQLKIQAKGLTGHLDEFWPDLGPNSGWLGGDGEAWERGPYFLDGLVPLAYLLQDPALTAKAEKWVNWTLTHQRADGLIGPTRNEDWWPRMVMLKVLTQYAEATGDERVIPVMQRYFAYRAREIDKRPLFEWGKYRWQEEVLSIIWLYNRTGDRSLLDLARKIHSQGHDWRRQFEQFDYFTSKKTYAELGGTPGQPIPDRAMQAHGVNNAMALKASGVWSLVSGDQADRKAVYQQLAMLDQYHRLPNGMFSADEHYAGQDPSQGIELCAVVESMFSYELLSSILGDPAFGDRLEKVAFNALPGTFSDDMWAHQYDQQPNQIKCSLDKRQWTSNGPESNLFGLEPNFGCCTANMHQGWPKFAANLWMGTADDGLAAIAYAPSEIRTVVKGGVPVTVAEDTEYPFRETISLTITPEKPARFPLRLRIPAWAGDATIRINGKLQPGVRAATFYRTERLWRAGDRVEIKFPMQPRVSRWYHDSVSIERGPVVYSLPIETEWRKLKDRGPTADWEALPTGDWNFGLVLNEKSLANSIKVVEKSAMASPFTLKGNRVELVVRGRRVPQWKMEQNSAGPLPESPVQSGEPETSLTLVPYGAAKLRITAFPQIAVPRPDRGAGR